jgi:hypothetical protein
MTDAYTRGYIEHMGRSAEFTPEDLWHVKNVIKSLVKDRQNEPTIRDLLQKISMKPHEAITPQKWAKNVGILTRSLLLAGMVEAAFDCATQFYNWSKGDERLIAQSCADAFLHHGPTRTNYLRKPGYSKTVSLALGAIALDMTQALPVRFTKVMSEAYPTNYIEHVRTAADLTPADFLEAHNVIKLLAKDRNNEPVIRRMLHTISMKQHAAIMPPKWAKNVGLFTRSLLQAGMVETAFDCATQFYNLSPEGKQRIAQVCVNVFLDQGPTRNYYLKRPGHTETVAAALGALETPIPFTRLAELMQVRATSTPTPLAQG